MPDHYSVSEIQGFLKELVGPQGCFILMIDAPKGPAGQDCQVHYHGPFTRLIGLLAYGGGVMDGRCLDDNVQQTLQAMREGDDERKTPEEDR